MDGGFFIRRNYSKELTVCYPTLLFSSHHTRMKTRFLSLGATLLLLTACNTSVLDDSDKELPDRSSPFTGDEVEIDYDGSYISFTGKSNIVNHQCAFDEYEVTMDLDDTTPEDLTKAVISAEIEIASIRTEDEMLTGHLQKADFFDAENFPTVTFESTTIEKKEGDNYTVTGNLTIKGITKPIVLNATITNNYMTLTGNVPRKDFNVGNDSYGDKILELMVPMEAKLIFKK